MLIALSALDFSSNPPSSLFGWLITLRSSRCTPSIFSCFRFQTFDESNTCYVQTAILRSQLVCPASQDISSRNTVSKGLKRADLRPTLWGIAAATLAVGLAVGLLLLLTVRFRQGTPTHNLLSDKLQGLVVFSFRSTGKGAAFFLLLGSSTFFCRK